MTVYLLPTTRQLCVSYSLSSDLLNIQSHMKDGFAKISVLNKSNGTYKGPIRVGPMILKQGLNILNSETRFKICDKNFAQIWLQGTKVIADKIYTSPHRRPISNIHQPQYTVCWGENFSGVTTMRGMFNAFFGSPFNGDLCGPSQTEQNCQLTRDETTKTEQHNFKKSNFNLISIDAHALFILYKSDVKDMANFFKMSCAGFQPLSENENIMIIPLKETILTFEGVEYHGFLTSQDNCKKKWFILPDGKIVGQYNYKTMSIRQPVFPTLSYNGVESDED